MSEDGANDATGATRREGPISSRDAPDGTEATRREGPGSSAPHSGKSPAASAEPAPGLSRGTLVGRYVILDVLGEGGMGVVYAAFDPELDRKVAVKLLQANATGSESGGQAWLMREAQAMARLSHPNVIAVHDVGTLPGDRVFVAMELVDGGTLRTWMGSAHTWREIVAVMRAAGAGLAAAHGAGLVHRDFKPDNVLVGKDGRVRVMDFGLARLGDRSASRDSDLSIERRSPLSDRLTIAGTVVGTPAYMAPELYAGDAADARSDQFAFGVALYEALFKARPYDKRELKGGSASRPKPPPANSGVPARVQRVVMRAISFDPVQRFESMAALLDELAVDPAAKRRRVGLAVAGIVAVAAVATGGYALTRSKDQVCKGTERKLAGAWDPPARQAIKAAFTATQQARAGAAYEALARVLDRFTGDWTKTAVESCEATRVHRDQSEGDMSLRSDCLDARLAELRALTGLFAKADAGMIDKAEKAAQGLDPISACSDLAQLRAPEALPASARESLAKLNEQIAGAKAAILATKIDASVALSDAAVDTARAMKHDPAIAEALMQRGTTSFFTGNMVGAMVDLKEAVSAAIRGRRDDVLAQAALLCAIVTAQARKDDAAEAWLSVGIAAAERSPGQRVIQLRRYQTEGIVLARGGDMKRGIAADEKALELATELYGKEGGLSMVQAEQELATAYAGNVEYAKAEPHLLHALAVLEKSVGSDNPDSATLLGTLGLVYAHTGEIAKAREVYERGISVREKALGKDNPALIPALNNLADMLRQHGDPEHALVYIERAMAIVTKFGKTNPLYQTIATTYGEVLYDAGKPADARAQLDSVLASEEQSHSNVLAQTLLSRAQLEVKAAKWADAAAFASRAIPLFEASAGKDAPSLWPPLVALAEAKAGLGQKAEAKQLFDRAFAIAKAAQTVDSELAEARAVYAKLP